MQYKVYSCWLIIEILYIPHWISSYFTRGNIISAVKMGFWVKSCFYLSFFYSNWNQLHMISSVSTHLVLFISKWAFFLSDPPLCNLMTNIHWDVMLIWFLSGLSLALNKEGCDWKDRHSARANSGRATHLSQTRYTPLVEVNQAIKAWSF